MEIKIYQSLQSALTSLSAPDVKLTSQTPVSGGDINDAYRLVLSNGETVFLKTNRKENLPFFTTEAAGLAAIAGTHTIRTPKVLALGTDDERNISFLMLEYAEPERSGKNARNIRGTNEYWRVFGRELAAMHTADVSAYTGGKKFGFSENNYIGAGPQDNTTEESWIVFFREHRLKPQISRAAASGYLSARDKEMANVLLQGGALENVLIEPAYPSLLHGDLWGGNVLPGTDGKAWLIDPAAYVGHAEADIAMTELFGGFPRAFYEAYQEVSPLASGYEKRRDLYNLYHLLNHLNLFGAGYLPPVRRILAEYC